MKKPMLRLASVGLALGLSACTVAAQGVTQHSVSPTPAVYKTSWEAQEAAKDTSALADALDRFSQESFTALLKMRDTPNLLYSPTSLYMALSMLADATAGETLADLNDALNADADLRQPAISGMISNLNRQITEGDSKSFLNNALWIKDGLSYTENYKTILKDIYHADSYTWRQGAEKEANQAMGKWVEDKTQKLLPASSIPEDFPGTNTIMALLNALYYKSSWGFPFDAANTTAGEFTTASGVVQADYMQQTLAKANAVVRENYTVADMQMADLGRMRFVLPAEGIAAEELAEQPEFYHDLFRLERSDNAIVHWLMPKVDLDGTLDLLPLLEEMGLGRLMSGMDLSAGLAGDQGGFLSAANQSVRITMDEKGVEAAAVTLLGVDESAQIDPLEVTMDLNRPYYCALISPTGEVLFMAFIGEP